MAENKKLVILFNIGSPESFGKIREFLFNFFMDKEILPVPYFIRLFLALLISLFRAGKALEKYKIIGDSPLLEITKQQASKLGALLGNGYDVCIAMRYSPPYLFESLKTLHDKNYEKIIFLPLYPQYSFATSRSAINEFKKVIQKYNHSLKDRAVIIDRFYDNNTFIKAFAENILNSLPANKLEYNFLFCAHGIPIRNIKNGDSYAKEVSEMVELTMKELKNYDSGFENAKYAICYQSKVGPLKWLEPSTKDLMLSLSKNGVKNIALIPVSFVAENLETIHELDIELKKYALSCGIKNYLRIPCLNDSVAFINSLAHIVKNAERKNEQCI